MLLGLNTKISFKLKRSVVMSEKETLLVQLGLRVKELRKDKGISQEQLGEISGLHRTYIGMIERGEKNITVYNIWLISKALETDIKTIFNGY